LLLHLAKWPNSGAPEQPSAHTRQALALPLIRGELSAGAAEPQTSPAACGQGEKHGHPALAETGRPQRAPERPLAGIKPAG